MSSELEIAVIADDLTGAADTGARFCPAVGPQDGLPVVTQAGAFGFPHVSVQLLKILS
jgi:hypothetical protein